MRLLVCLTLIALPVFGQANNDPRQNSLTFGEVQELLDRFGGTTMRSIEDQLRTKLDEYESSLEKSRNGESEEVIQPDVPVTYRLTFTISNGSAPVTILATPGEYSLNATQNDREQVENSSTSSDYVLQCKGTVGPATTQGKVRVRFKGISSLSRTEMSEGSQQNSNSSVDFNGSADITIGKSQEIASNNELRIVLQVDEVRDETLVEQAAPR